MPVNPPHPPDLFLHIPRTAGTTLWGALRRVYGQRHVLRVLDGTMPENTRSLEARLRAGGSEQHHLLGGHYYLSQALMTLDPARRHFTMLRRPADRGISTYYKIIRKDGHRLHDSFIADNVTLEDSFMRMPRDLQTRLLADVPEDHEVSALDLERAKERLRTQFVVIGLTERFDESLLLFQRALGWSSPLYKQRNVSGNRPDTLPDSIYTLAEAANPYDVQLYAYAETLFNQQVQAQDADFGADLADFREALAAFTAQQASQAMDRADTSPSLHRVQQGLRALRRRLRRMQSS